MKNITYTEEKLYNKKEKYKKKYSSKGKKNKGFFYWRKEDFMVE